MMNLDEEEIDFEKLSTKDCDFAAAIQANGGHIDFNNPRIVKYELLSTPGLPLNNIVYGRSSRCVLTDDYIQAAHYHFA